MCLTRFYSVFKVQRPCGLSLFAERKWRMRESNSRPPACKAGALPSELIPRVVRLLNSGFLRVWAERMGPSGLEPPTSRLSGARSNRLSYGPLGSFRFGYERRLSPYLSWNPRTPLFFNGIRQPGQHFASQKSLRKAACGVRPSCRCGLFPLRKNKWHKHESFI